MSPCRAEAGEGEAVLGGSASRERTGSERKEQTATIPTIICLQSQRFAACWHLVYVEIGCQNAGADELLETQTPERRLCSSVCPFLPVRVAEVPGAVEAGDADLAAWRG